MRGGIKLIIVIVIAAIVGLGYLAARPYILAHNYKGAVAVLKSPSKDDESKIEQIVMAEQPTVPAGTLVDINIDQFTGLAARGTAVYHGEYPKGYFLAVKTGTDWKVISYSKDGTLTLPDRSTARKYSLPSGWFKN